MFKKKRHGKINMTNHLDFKKKKNSSRASYLTTIEVVNQIREDIKDLKKDSTTSFEFTLWSNVDCEDAHNFTYYFPSCNPGKLGEKDMKIT